MASTKITNPTKTDPGKISKIHKLFADNYLISFNAKKAYEKAFPGSKSSNCNPYVVLKRPEVIEYIKEKQNELDAKTLITRGRIFQMLLDVYNKSMEPEAVYYQDKVAGMRMSNINTAKGAAELMGRAIGMFDDKMGSDRSNANLTQIMVFMDEKIPTVQLGNGKTKTIDAKVIE